MRDHGGFRHLKMLVSAISGLAMLWPPASAPKVDDGYFTKGTMDWGKSGQDNCLMLVRVFNLNKPMSGVYYSRRPEVCEKSQSAHVWGCGRWEKQTIRQAEWWGVQSIDSLLMLSWMDA